MVYYIKKLSIFFVLPFFIYHFPFIILRSKAHRKAKFLLHPDKLPRDLTENQIHVCKLIWDIIQDAGEAFFS